MEHNIHENRLDHVSLKFWRNSALKKHYRDGYIFWPFETGRAGSQPGTRRHEGFIISHERTLWERAAHSVDHMFSLYFDYL